MAERLVLVLGGTRSGKSRFGLRRMRELAGERRVTYIATARPGDPELDERIAGHRAARPSGWPTVMADVDLAATFRSVDSGEPILLDGLTLWLSDALDRTSERGDGWVESAVQEALAVVRQRSGAVVIVSDEIGLGMVPMEATARRFRDLLGNVHQRVAAEADEAYLVVAGIPVALRSR
jgi:adenosylcobinamide kinase/adenosylcobinamide-phosphate guanylyltransferase